MSTGHLWCDLTSFQQALDVAGPFLAELVSAGQRPVAADHNQAVNAPLEQILARAAPAFVLVELRASSRADHGSALVQN